MLSASLPLIGPAASGLGGLALGTVGLPALGLAGLALAALFTALLGGLPDAGEPAATAASVFAPRQSLLCAAAFTAIGGLAGGLAWQVWTAQGPRGALGLVAAAVACVAVALGFAAGALRRRG